MSPLSFTVPDKYFLYADDDEDDQELLIDIVRKVDPSIAIICCDHGWELMQFLDAVPGGAFLPCCIVLDMNMPIWNGLHTLQELRKKEVIKQIPIIMFTTSSEIQDAERSIKLGASAFLTKPAQAMEFERIAKQFSMFCETSPIRKQFA